MRDFIDLNKKEKLKKQILENLVHASKS